MGASYTREWRQVDTPRIACLGELLWDVFPDGERLGGAPANVAFHAARLGANASLHSRIGSDALGDLALVELARARVDTRAVERDPLLPTGTVLVSLDRGEPSYTIVAPAAWDHIERAPVWLADATAAGVVPDVLVFGSLAARRSEQAARLSTWLGQLRGSEGRRPKLAFDLNLRRPHLPIGFIRDAIALTDLLKLNEEEFAWLGSAGMNLVPAGPLDHERAAVDQLFARFALEFVVVTRGARGATLFSREHTHHVPGIPVTLGDAVGAGDAFLAALLVGLLRGEEAAACLEEANRCAAEVAASRGAMGSS